MAVVAASYAHKAWRGKSAFLRWQPQVVSMIDEGLEQLGVGRGIPFFES